MSCADVVEVALSIDSSLDCEPSIPLVLVALTAVSVGHEDDVTSALGLLARRSHTLLAGRWVISYRRRMSLAMASCSAVLGARWRRGGGEGGRGGGGDNDDDDDDDDDEEADRGGGDVKGEDVARLRLRLRSRSRSRSHCGNETVG